MRRLLALVAVLALVVAFSLPVVTAEAASHKDKKGKVENPCNPCAAKAKASQPCNPCNPCAAKAKKMMKDGEKKADDMMKKASDN